MTTITRFHVTMLQTSALPEIVAGEGGQPTLGSLSEYISTFTAAPTEGAAWLKPWGKHTTGHKYWASLLGGQYAKRTESQTSEKKAQSAWAKQIPLRRAQGFTPSVQESLGPVSVTCERYLYPAGVGVEITATFEGAEALKTAEELHSSLSQDAVFIAADGKARRIDSILRHELGQLEKDVLGKPSAAAVSSHPWMVTTIAGTGGPALGDAVADVLTRMCYPGQEPGRAKELKPKSGKFSETIRVTGQQALASWAPRCSATYRRSEGLTCYHHNVVLSTLQTLQLLSLVELAAEDYMNAPAS